MVLALGIIAYSENIKPIGIVEKIKRSNTNEQSNITTIDVTGIVLGKETQHEHIYKTMYDNSEHWEECTVCGEKKNQKVHSLTTTWALGYESCYYTNSYTKTCSCGYSMTGHKPCVWDGKSYYKDPHYHVHGRWCKNCNYLIHYSYYLYSYANGEEYTAIYDSKNVDEEFPFTEYCHLLDGNRIKCTDFGTCIECSNSYTSVQHRLQGEKEGEEQNGNISCRLCNKDFGTYSQDITRDSNVPTTWTLVTKISFKNGASLAYEANRLTGSCWDSNNGNITNINSDRTEVTLTYIAKFNSAWKVPYYAWVTANANIDGKYTICSLKSFTVYPDFEPPVLSNILVENSDLWYKNKMITISGIEHFTDVVSVEILDDRKNCIYTGKTNLDWSGWTSDWQYGTYSFSCVPDLEANDIGRVFTAIVKDTSDNKIEKTFVVSKIDGVAPEITSCDKVSDGWEKEKSFTAIASDHGIGNVQIAFNDVSDYSLANKNGTEYTREYKLTGDVYTAREANVYYKDELGNVSTKKVKIDKIDNTAPTITSVSFSNNKLNITSHDRHQTEGEGSGVAKYRFITSTVKLENPEITLDNSTEVLVNENMIIPDIYKVKYVYVVAEDAVGNISEVYEVKVPQLELTSKVNLNGVNGKGVVELDWSGYDITNKYFVIYRKQEGEEEWKTIVKLDEKFNNNKYTDNLANDKIRPSTPSINIEGNIENNNIEIAQGSTDIGTRYLYYIEAYDIENTLIASSK